MKPFLWPIVLAILILVQFPFSTKIAHSASAADLSVSGTVTSVNRYALIVCGTLPQPGSPPHRGDTTYMYHVLCQHCKFNSITYLSCYHDDPNVTGSATVQNVRNAITSLVNNRINPQSSDIIFIYISTEGVGLNQESDDHTWLRYPSLQDSQGRISSTERSEVSYYYDYYGALKQNNPIAVDAGLVLEDTTLPPSGQAQNAYWSSDLKNDLNGLNGNNGILVYVQQSCFAGDMIYDLSGPNRTIMCSTSETWSSFGDSIFDSSGGGGLPPDWGFGISEWSERFIDALNGDQINGYMRAYFDNTNDKLVEDVNHYWDPTADKDGNGVSMLEAWQWALANDQATIPPNQWEIPWFDDNGGQLPTYYYGQDLPANQTEGTLSSEIFFSPLACDLNGDNVVDIYDAIIFANSFNTKLGDQRWNPSADFNKDGQIDMYDAIIFASHFNSKRPSIGGGIMGKPNGAKEAGQASIALNPAQTTVFKGEVFAVNVDVTSVTDLQGWEFQLYWDNTVLNCRNVVVQTPSEWQNNTLNFGSGLQENYNATTARYSQAQAATYPAPSFNGSMTIVTLTFQALQPGTTPLTLADVKLGNSTADPIACTVSSGSVNVYYGRYMRSDTQTINGLGAYVLNIPESTSSAYVTQSGSGHGASWGIRAWVRHSNGVEQEISLDGQTGTPKAVVGRSSGSGIESGTVSVAQTALQQTDSLVIRVYVQVGGSGWTLCATFTTEQLQATALQGTTWTVYYYTYAYWLRWANWTTSTFYWGTTTYNSRIQNLQCT